MINSSINPSVDPCEDFYQYVCGGWIQEKLSIKYNYPDKFQEAEGVISKDLNKLIEDTFRNPNISDTSTAISKAEIFYHSCVNMCSNMERQHELSGYVLRATVNREYNFFQKFVLKKKKKKKKKNEI